FKGKDLVSYSDKQMRRIRGNDIAMIFQEPMTSLNPLFTIGNQMVEAIRMHERKKKRQQARHEAIEMQELVGLPTAADLFNAYPRKGSGGRGGRGAMWRAWRA